MKAFFTKAVEYIKASPKLDTAIKSGLGALAVKSIYIKAALAFAATVLGWQ